MQLFSFVQSLRQELETREADRETSSPFINKGLEWHYYSYSEQNKIVNIISELSWVKIDRMVSQKLHTTGKQ